MTQERRRIIIGYLCAVAATILWGVDSVIIRWLIGSGVHPFLVGEFRLLVGSTFLIVIVAISTLIRNKKIFPQIHYSKFFWLIALSLAINFMLFHKGLQYTIASDAALIEAFAPIMVLIIVMLFIPDRIRYLLHSPGGSRKILFILLIGCVGSAFLLVNDVHDILMTSRLKFLGDIIEFAAMFSWALVLLGMHEYQHREGSKYNILAVTSQFLFFAGIILAPFVPWLQILQISSQQWLWLIVLGIGSTGIAYVLWHIASKNLDVFPLMALFSIMSIFTVVTESIFLGLEVSWKLAIGGILILYAAIQAKEINSKYKTASEGALGEKTE